jgi:predicted DNA-binding protein (MmcQ/YjbR family)
MDETSITEYIVGAFEGVDVVAAGPGTFFSLDPERHWPNFATIVTSDEYDQASNLDRPGVYRLNIGVSGATFRSRFDSESTHDLTELDRLMPHPVYARQHWVSILNPTDATFETVVKPLLQEAHGLIARRQKKR